MDIEAHAKKRIVELGREMESRVAIYLDVNYWLILRDAASGKRGTEAAKLLLCMREAVFSGRVFCPISETVLIELLKQNDRKSRKRTAAIVDELSLGVTLIPQKTRIATELAHFIQTHTPPPGKSLHPLGHLVWSKVGYTLGFLFPSVPALDTKTNFEVQKMFFDHVWRMTLVEMVDEFDDPGPFPKQELVELTARLNTEVAAHSDRLTSFAKAYEDELFGTVDLHGDTVVEIFHDMARQANIEPPPTESEQSIETRRLGVNLIFAALKKATPRQQLKSIHAMAAMHAAIRWNKGRKFKPNDLYDLDHAAAALAHCRALFTEESLSQLVTAKHVALDKLFECHVVTKIPNALDYLASLKC